MLYNQNGKVVHPKQRGANHIEEHFVVSHRKDEAFLRPLRETKEYLLHKCGKMFSIGERFHAKL